MSVPTRIPAGSDDTRTALNGASELITANSTAFNMRKNVHIFAGGAGLTGITMAAPTKLGEEHVVVNSVAFTAVLTITSPVFAGADVFSFPAAATTVLPSLVFKAIDVTPTATTRSLKWALIGAAGGVTIS